MKKLFAYLDDGKPWEKKHIDLQKLTGIFYAFATVKDGQCTEHFQKIRLLQELKEEKPELLVMLSIGGWTADGFSDAVLDKESRQLFIDSILAKLDEYGFDGVDLDWEYPTFDQAGIKARPADNVNFVAFLRELKAEIAERGQRYLVTAAIGAHPKIISALLTDGAEFADYLDWINIMTYDLRGSGQKIAGHHTNLSSCPGNEVSARSSVQQLLDLGIPSDKLVIGCAFYGRVWTNPYTENRIGAEFATTGAETIDQNEFRLIKEQFVEHWDEAAEATFYTSRDQLISIDSKASLAAKAAFINEANLLGGMYWEHSLDLKQELVTAFYDALQKTPVSSRQ